MSEDCRIEELLDKLGFTGAKAHGRARQELDSAGLTNPKRDRVSLKKRRRIEDFLRKKFVRTCEDSACQSALERERSGIELVPVDDAHNCECCGGSEEKRAMRDFSSACRSRGRVP